MVGVHCGTTVYASEYSVQVVKIERATVIGFECNTTTLVLIHLPLLHNIEPIVTTQTGQRSITQCKQPIMSEATYKCELCGRDNFKSQRGLSKHKLENKARRDHLKVRFGSNTDTKIAAAYLPVDTVHKPQNCTAGSHNAMHYPDMSDGLGAKRAKYMSLPDKDFISAWLMKAQSQLEQSQAHNDSDADVGMYDAENDVILPPTEESSARQKLMLDNFKIMPKEPMISYL